MKDQSIHSMITRSKKKLIDKQDNKPPDNDDDEIANNIINPGIGATPSLLSPLKLRRAAIQGIGNEFRLKQAQELIEDPHRMLIDV